MLHKIRNIKQDPAPLFTVLATLAMWVVVVKLMAEQLSK